MPPRCHSPPGTPCACSRRRNSCHQRAARRARHSDCTTDARALFRQARHSHDPTRHRWRRPRAPAATEAAWTHLCGVAPIEASSGKVTRHRLNRGGDHHANQALWRIVVVRLVHDPRTRHYLERRAEDGLSKREVIRVLKRYVAPRSSSTYPARSPSSGPGSANTCHRPHGVTTRYWHGQRSGSRLPDGLLRPVPWSRDL